MTEHSEHPGPTQTFFSEEEWQRFRAEDHYGAKVIVSLMAGIFIIGLILYSIVAWAVS